MTRITDIYTSTSRCSTAAITSECSTCACITTNCYCTWLSNSTQCCSSSSRSGSSSSAFSPCWIWCIPTANTSCNRATGYSIRTASTSANSEFTHAITTNRHSRAEATNDPANYDIDATANWVFAWSCAKTANYSIAIANGMRLFSVSIANRILATITSTGEP